MRSELSNVLVAFEQQRSDESIKSLNRNGAKIICSGVKVIAI
jgi:hypothetical protein